MPMAQLVHCPAMISRRNSPQRRKPLRPGREGRTKIYDGHGFFDGAFGFQGKINELDAYAHARQAISDFSANFNRNIHSIQTKFNAQDGAFRESP
jgi:hypothetical protein